MKANEKNERMEHLLECLIHIIGRIAVPIDKVYEIIGNKLKQIKAFNMCDGETTQSKIAKQCRIDPGSFNRTISRWLENGIVYYIGKGKDAKLFHIYPIPKPLQKKKN